METNEEQGVKAIIYLQGMAGIVEPEEKARANWRAFTEEQKARTMFIYDLVKEAEDEHK